MKTAKRPNKYFAPLAIAGITVAVLAKAYQAIFKKDKLPAETNSADNNQHLENSAPLEKDEDANH
ncbi:hypothetical protein [Acinetobacter sp. MD2(2019)]|uniref:hypothetical protein n=1 Tax=Acinetobacter sp. MD2(2019) TaxID=2605273 RepID=UPI002D1EA135|nr:hypothetical protein [Acinetobacter sp. MD2(2019)]MEB3754832.1 hypothetical protein [Acinetobacter sp. MD2(2019)]